jgi:transcriptional regulator with XRE-family HTH domain
MATAGGATMDREAAEEKRFLLAPQLRAILKRKGFRSFRAAASHLGMAPTKFHGYVSGRTNPGAGTLLEILDGLGVTFEELLATAPLADETLTDAGRPRKAVTAAWGKLPDRKVWRAIRLEAQGLSLVEIAAKIDRDPKQVRDWLYPADQASWDWVGRLKQAARLGWRDPGQARLAAIEAAKRERAEATATG